MATALKKNTPSDIAVACKDITKTFVSGDVQTHALRGVNLSIHKREFFMIVGPSGCGKTTLLSIIAGILQQTSGICSVEGNDYRKLSDEDILTFRAQHVGFIFQSFNLIPSLTVLENITIPLIIQGMERENALTLGKEILEKVGLKNRGNESVTKLSGGEQQRVAIARSLIHKPSLLICDEPTSALDHETGEKIIALMQKINREIGTTFVIVTHDNRIFHYADRIAHMDDGRIVSISQGEHHA